MMGFKMKAFDINSFEIKKGVFLSLLMAWFIATTSFAAQPVIKVNDFSDPNGPYVVSVIKLANEHIDNKYKIEVSHKNYTQAKVNEEVKGHGEINMVWTTGDAQVEEEFRPIRIPLYKGMIGYRLLIIHKGDQAKFDNVRTLADLQKFKLGQGKTWGDTKILESNGLNVVKATKYPNLFYMLDGGRFDAFPRGAHEPWGELASRPNLELTVEKNLIVAYKLDLYLFVAKDDIQLASDIERGLNLAIADGSFDKNFFTAPAVKDVVEKADMRHRRVININNPLMSKETPLDRKELWIDPQTL